MHICMCIHISLRYYFLFYLILFIVITSIKISTNKEVRNKSENVTFSCQAVGEPVPNITWYFDGIMLNVSVNNSKYIIVSRSSNITTTESTLTLYNVTPSDVGIYTCNSSYEIGIATSFGVLVVACK